MQKHSFLIVIGIALTLALPAAAEEANGMLMDEERAKLVEMLESSRSETEGLVARAHCDNWGKKPAEDSWSVGEVIEHIVLAEQGIFANALGALEAPEDPEWQALTGTPVEGLITMIKDRSQKFQAPDPFVPKGEMDRGELLQKFGAARAATIDFVRSTQAPVKRHSAEGPAGKMNVQQWMALIAGHNMRHNAQIVEALEKAGDC